MWTSVSPCLPPQFLQAVLARRWRRWRAAPEQKVLSKHIDTFISHIDIDTVNDHIDTPSISISHNPSSSISISH